MSLAKSTENIRIFECFKAGKHTSMGGQEKDWTSEEVAGIARAFNLEEATAPLCLGHPADNLPAFGQVVNLIARQGFLYAVADVGAGLLNAVKQGSYKNVSIALKWGKFGWTLRHIGFLGAHPPAVKGLAELNFGEMVEPPGSLCFAAPTGMGIRQRAAFTIPAGYQVTPEGLAHYLKATEIEAACPSLSFAECATLAAEYLL